MTGKAKPLKSGRHDALPRVEGVSEEKLAQMRKESRENMKTIRRICGMDPDEIPKGPISIAGILSDLGDPEEDSVELVKSVRYD